MGAVGKLPAQMARKQKRRNAQVRARGRQQITPAAPAPQAAATTQAQAARGGRVGGDQALVRAVEMSLGSNVQVRGKGRNRVIIETGTPAIPLDRVPYFLTDLRQVAIVGAVMLV